MSGERCAHCVEGKTVRYCSYEEQTVEENCRYCVSGWIRRGHYNIPKHTAEEAMQIAVDAAREMAEKVAHKNNLARVSSNAKKFAKNTIFLENLFDEEKNL